MMINFTVFLWIRTSLGSGGVVIANSQMPLSDGTVFHLQTLGGGHLELIIGLNNAMQQQQQFFNNNNNDTSFNNITIRSTLSLKVNRWHHVAIVRSWNNVRLYIDATLVGWKSIEQAQLQTSSIRPVSNFAIGCIADRNGTIPSIGASGNVTSLFLFCFCFVLVY